MLLSTIRRIFNFFLLILISVMPVFCSVSDSAENLTKYVVTAMISPEKASSSGELMIRWRNDSSLPVKTIPLSFCNFADVEKNKMIDMITQPIVNGKSVKLQWKPKEREEDYLGFDLILEDEIKPGSAGEIKMRFKSGKFSYKFGYYRYLDDWFPRIVQRKDGKPDPKLQSLSDFDMTLTYPSDFKVALSGSILSHRENGRLTTIRSTAKDIPSYGILISKDFLVEEGESGGVKIVSYFLKGDEKWGKNLLEYSKDIIPFYQKEIGFYPQPVLYILPGYPDRPAGGYPVCPNCIVIHRNLDSIGKGASDFAQWITAHEIGHQYWGFGYVLEDMNYPQWFGLSMGIYTDRLYTEARGLNDKSHRNFVIRYLGGVLAGVDTTIMQRIADLDKVGFDSNNVIWHGKSYTVLTMLENHLGADVFKEIFRESLKRYKGKTVTLETFQSLCEEISRKDLGWFFDQWYRSSKYLDYQIAATRTKKEGDKFVTESVVVRKGDAAMPLEVELECHDGKKYLKKIDGWTASTAVRFETSAPPVMVVLDPRERLPLLSRAEKSQDAITAALNELRSLNDFAEASRLLRLLQVLNPDTVMFNLWSGLVSRSQGDFKRALERYTIASKLNMDPDFETYKDMIVLQLGMTCDLMGNREEALKHYKQIPEDSRYQRLAKTYINTPYDNFNDSRD